MSRPSEAVKVAANAAIAEFERLHKPLGEILAVLRHVRDWRLDGPEERAVVAALACMREQLSSLNIAKHLEDLAASLKDSDRKKRRRGLFR